MMLTFGQSPADVVTDTAGNIMPGRDLTIWTAENGSQITDLTTLDGTPLPGKVTTDAEGRYPFRTDTELRTLWAKPPTGDMWPISATEALNQLGQAVEDSAEALELAQSTAGILFNVGEYLTQAMLDGTDNANSAIQAAVDDAPPGATITFPPNLSLRGDGDYINLQGKHGLVIDFQGTEIYKTTASGTYVLFLAREGGTGYGASIRWLKLKNGRFRGTPEQGMCVFNGNHSQHVVFDRCEMTMCVIQSQHSFDMGGCDDVTYDHCVWYGANYTGVPRTEAINTDVSVNGSGAGVAPNLDGLTCRGFKLIKCEFWPLVLNGVTYPSPVPMGSHLAREGQPFRNMDIDALVVDPPVDADSDTGLAGDNPYYRGLFHWPATEGLKVKLKVVSTTGQGTIRAVSVSSTSYGSQASTDPNTGSGQGAFTTPDAAKDIDIDVRVEGFNKVPTTGINPVVSVVGLAAAPAEDVRVFVSADGATDGIYMRNVNKAIVDGQMRDTTKPTTIDNTVTGLTFGPGLGKRTSRQATDQTVNNSATLVDSGLVLDVDPNAVYRLTGLLQYKSGTTPDVKFGFTVPSGATLRWSASGISTGASTTVSSVYRVASDAATPEIAGGNTGSDMVGLPQGLLVVGATGGQVKLQFAQSVADASDTILRAGSHLVLDRIA